MNNKLLLAGWIIIFLFGALFLTEGYAEEGLFIKSVGSHKQLTMEDCLQLSPSFSPDETKIVYHSYEDRGDYADIWVMNSDGTKHSQLTNNDFEEISPRFSPDGKKMLYVSDVNGISNIYLRETDTSGVTIDRPITNSLNPISQISLSKDGKKLLFVSLMKSNVKL